MEEKWDSTDLSYKLHTKKAANILHHPSRFHVKVSKLALAKLLLKELIHYKGNKDLILSRPCLYGVFSGPIGGFAPKEQLCVGCLRCTTQHPQVVQIFHNPQKKLLGDSYFHPEIVDRVIYEAESGRVPIKGAGYRGKFGGEGWDGMWTDMSEIVRPTRDGIHGREFISTQVDLGGKAAFLKFDPQKQLCASPPLSHSLPIPLLFDLPPSANLNHTALIQLLSSAAEQIQTAAILPLKTILSAGLLGKQLIPMVAKEDLALLQTAEIGFKPLFVEIEQWHAELLEVVKSRFPDAMIILRTDFENENLLSYYKAGIRVFHLTADYHGRGLSGKFALDLIKSAHQKFVHAKCREEVTIIGSGGIIAAEHLPKAILCGLDAVALDSTILVALQAQFKGECVNRHESNFQLPLKLTVEWGVQRLINLLGSWRDQLLEILGAMGLREVRRMRGELGRAMFQKELEAEAFKGIAGYELR